MTIRWNVVGLSVLMALLLAHSLGCAAASRSLGNIPSSTMVGANAIDASGFPLDEDLWIEVPFKSLESDQSDIGGQPGVRAVSGTTAFPLFGDNGQQPHPNSVDYKERRYIPLVRIGIRPTLTTSDRFLNGPYDGARHKTAHRWSDHSAYMVIDVANASRIPHLGAYKELDSTQGTELDLVAYRRRLGKIAYMLIHAADQNGDVYWRNLTTFLEYIGSLESAAEAAQGAGIAATFISPVLGAALSGGGLAADAFVADLTDEFNVETYAELREAVATSRDVIRGKIHDAVEVAMPEKNGLESVLRLANDYAYSYSLKGTINLTKDEDEKLKDYLVTGDSSWRAYFLDEQLRYLRAKLVGASTEDAAEINRQIKQVTDARSAA